jgi:chromosome segregation ATPase
MRRLAVLVLLAGCAAQNAADPRDRGFLGGMGAALTGEDERRAQALEGQAASAEQQALRQRADPQAAERRAAQSAAARRDAERRYAALDRDIAALRQQVAAARARGAATEPAARDLERLEQQRRAAPPLDPEALRDLEARRDALSRTLRAL